MRRFAKLRGAICEAGIKYKELAVELENGYSTLSHKFCGKCAAEFTVRDAYKIMDKLGISHSDIDTFFSPEDILAK
jgi:hypothetical protein